MMDALIAGRVHGQPTLRAQVLALRRTHSARAVAQVKQPPVNGEVNTKYRICRGAVTAAVTAKLHFCECFQAEVSKQVSTESGIFWAG